MKISDVGLHMITAEEGCLLFPYDDHDDARLHFDRVARRYLRADGSPPKGYPTIGIGHLIRPGEIFGDITLGQAFALERLDLADVEAALNRQVPETTPGWNQNRYDAMCDFGINAGTLAITKYHLLAPILAQDWPLLETRLKAVNKSGGLVAPVLVRRRAREFVLLTTPMPEEPIDAAAVLLSVHDTALAGIQDFLAGNPIEDETAISAEA